MQSEQQFLDLDMEDNNNKTPKAKIAIDNREDKIFDELLVNHGAIVERAQLDIGDFICSARCIIERKTRQDFESSIVDGRLFPQLKNSLSNYQRVVVIVEGEESSGQISKEALLGAYASLITDFGISIFFTRNKEKTAELIYAIAKHEQLAKKRPMRIFAKRKALTLSQTQRSIIEMFPMVGPKLAKALLEHFGNIENIIKASERELAEVDGMGKKRAKIIHNIIISHYNEKDDEFDMV